jgi:hypothetical protein
MNFQHVTAAIAACYADRLPLFLAGPPGVGKSAAVRQAATDLGIELRDIRASQTDPVDWRGIPSIIDGKTQWCIPSFLPQSGAGILFLDELNAASQSVQVALYQLILDRRIGDYELPAGWYVMGAGNRVEDRAAAGRMSSALNNRLIHLEQTADVDSWLSWFWEKDLPEEVGFFISFRRECLFRFDPSSRESAFPTPRSWESAAKLYARGLHSDIATSLISGCIGQGAAMEFLAFCRIYKELPSLDGILMDPERANVPHEPSAIAATVSGLAKKASPASIANILKYTSRVSKEYEFLCLKLARRVCPGIEQTRAFAQWAVNNKDFQIAA